MICSAVWQWEGADGVAERTLTGGDRAYDTAVSVEVWGAAGTPARS